MCCYWPPRSGYHKSALSVWQAEMCSVKSTAQLCFTGWGKPWFPVCRCGIWGHGAMLGEHLDSMVSEISQIKPFCDSTEASPSVRKALSPERMLGKSHQESCLGLFSPCFSDENDSRNPWIVAFLAQFLTEGAQDSWVETVALKDLSWAVSPTQCCSGGHSLDSVVLEVFSSLN